MREERGKQERKRNKEKFKMRQICRTAAEFKGKYCTRRLPNPSEMRMNEGHYVRNG